MINMDTFKKMTRDGNNVVQVAEAQGGGGGGLDIFVAQFDETYEGDMLCDKTYEEIYAALAENKLILVFWGHSPCVYIAPATNVGGAIQFDFASVDTVSDHLWMDTLLMTPNSITRTTRECSLTISS